MEHLPERINDCPSSFTGCYPHIYCSTPSSYNAVRSTAHKSSSYDNNEAKLTAQEEEEEEIIQLLQIFDFAIY